MAPMNGSAFFTVTFYAHKGGTGRTLALANVARYLAEDMGYRVGLIDLDFEAPGLAHEALSDPQDEDLCKDLRKKKGLLNLLLNLSPLADCVVAPRPAGTGSLFLIQPGEGSFDRTDTYADLLSNFNAKLDETKGFAQMAEAAQHIIEDFAREFYLDFVFLDARTGRGPFFPIPSMVLNHALVLFVGLIEQSVQGSLQILNTVAPVGYSKVEAIVVASPVPVSGSQEVEDRLGRIHQELRRLSAERDSLSPRPFVFDVPSQVHVELPYSEAAAVKETYIIGGLPKSGLARAYVELARRLITVAHKRVGAADRVAVASLPNPSDAVHFAVEDVACEIVELALGRYYTPQDPEVVAVDASGRHFRELQLKDTDKQSRLPKTIKVYFFEATAPEAPWEQMHSDSGATEAFRIYDLLTIPHSYGSALARSMSEQVWVLEDLRAKLGAEGPLPACIDATRLSRALPNWRVWTVFRAPARGSSSYGIPFSATSTLLAVNLDLLQAHCSGIPGVGPESWLPTNWNLLYALLKRACLPFRFATLRRALFYEWMNVVTSFGGMDFRSAEGHVPDRPVFDESATIEGTLAFLNLWNFSDKTYFNLQEAPEAGMTAIAQAVADGKLGAGFAWLDSFRFSHEANNGGDPGLAKSLRFCSSGAQTKTSLKNLVLCRSPRHVLVDPRPLMAGWLAIFPRQNGEGDLSPRTRAALNVADLLFEDLTQLRMLREGFPIPNLEVVGGEITRVTAAMANDFAKGTKASRECWHATTNYRRFLLCLEESLTSGHRVPAFPNANRVTDAVIKMLRELMGEVAERRINLDDGDHAREAIRDRLRGLQKGL